MTGPAELGVTNRPEPRPPQVAGYFLLALGWTWTALGLAWISGAPATEPPTSWLRLVAGVGPLVAAAVMLQRTASSPQRRAFWSRIVAIKPVRPRWWVVVAAMSAGPGLMVWAFSDTREFDVSGPGAAMGVVAFAVAASFAEEAGWRGYALDALGNRRWRAAAVIATVWMVWHLPLYAIEGTFQNQDVGFGTTFFWIIQGAFLPQTILMIWILDHTQPSILPAVAFHGLVNVSGEVFAYSNTQQAIRLGLWLLLTCLVIIGPPAPQRWTRQRLEDTRTR